MATKPLIVPEPFTGDGSWDEWIDHFESAAAVNKWEDADKLLWLRVRLTSRAQKAYKNLPTDVKESYAACKKGLRERFEPAARKELYQAEFHARKKRRNEEWAAFAEDLKLLTEKAFPELQVEAREQLALSHYLGQIDSAQIAFSVKQRKPKSVDEAVSATLEMESYLNPKASRVSNVGLETENFEEPTYVAAVRAQQDTMMDMLRSVMERLERLEAGGASKGATNYRDDHYPGNRKVSGGKRQGDRSQGQGPSGSGKEGTKGQDRGPVLCRKCGKEGHYARGCAARKPGN